jgi:hypothetical protein
VVERIRVPVYALHATGDKASPPIQSRLLVEALRPRVEARFFEVGLLAHVDPVASPLAHLGDGVRLARFAGELLGSGEGWPRP